MTTILDKVQDFLAEDYPTDQKKLQSQLNTISKFLLDIGQLKVSTLISLLLLESKYLRPKNKAMTDFDRKIHLQEMTADAKKDYELACLLYELLTERRHDLRLLLER